MIISVQEAAQRIMDGGVVAFPTETVYGLGGDAFNPTALGQIYNMKGRPSDNPLIVHIHQMVDIFALAVVPDYAVQLARTFWPGPLTLVMDKKDGMPNWLGTHPANSTKTVALRMPSHPVALQLLQLAGTPIAAPSANIAGRPSPTSAEHVLEDFFEIGVVDGGSTYVGVESTVVDCTGAAPAILRHGAITLEMIEDLYSVAAPTATSAPISPGTKYKHYAPKAPMVLVVGDSETVAKYIKKKIKNLHAGVLLPSKTCAFFVDNSTVVRSLGDTIDDCAKKLYAHLREFDIIGVDKIFAHCPDTAGLGRAVVDRMIKASNGQVVEL